jgi:hypothetical protein
LKRKASRLKRQPLQVYEKRVSALKRQTVLSSFADTFPRIDDVPQTEQG